MAWSFRRNKVTSGPYRQPPGFETQPRPEGATPEQQSSIYSGFYGDMPVPATQYATSVTALASLDIQPSVATNTANAPVVQRADRKNGMLSTAGIQDRKATTPQNILPVYSSKFQPELIGPHVNYDQNNGWYIAYPAATVMLGGQHNLALSERVPQLPTRTSGGPGPGTMRQAPRFKSVQSVPRYSTMPPTMVPRSSNA